MSAPARLYRRWLAHHQPWHAAAQAALAERLRALPAASRPLLSVLMPVYDAPTEWLRRAVASLRAQVYPHWELCIANDASPAPHVRPLLAALAANDSRIRVVHRATNGHIAAASESALSLARGAWVALLDQDDELHPAALAEIVLAAARSPQAGLIYTDEDKLDARGRRFEPYFKPDWNPDLLLGQNYLSHLTALRTDLVRHVGGFRPGTDGCQDWDLFLRVTEHLAEDTARIVHLPRVLYHWRAHSGSTAQVPTQKSYATPAAQRVLAAACARRGLAATLEPTAAGHWRVRRALPSPPPRVALIIPTRDRLPLLRACIESLLTTTDYPDFEVLVVDNDSTDPATVTWLAAPPDARIRVLGAPGHFNYSALNNQAAAATTAPVLAFLNNDLTVISREWLAEMVSHALRPEVGAVGAMLYYPGDTIQHAGVVLGIGPVAGHACKHVQRGRSGPMNRLRLVQNYSAVTGACLVVRRDVFLAHGGFDATHLPVAFNDIDFCLRLRTAGRRIVWTPFAELYHHESASRGRDDTPARRAAAAAETTVMRERWAAWLEHDPAYHPALTREREDFSLRWITGRSHRARGARYLARFAARPWRYHGGKFLLASLWVLTGRPCARWAERCGVNPAALP